MNHGRDGQLSDGDVLKVGVGRIEVFSKESISVGVLDNDALALEALQSWFRMDPLHYHLLFAVSRPDQAVQYCLQGRLRPQVLVLDMSLGGGVSGADVCREIRRRSESVGLICVTAYSADRYRKEAAKAGAQALISKDVLNDKDLLSIVRLVAAGNAFPGFEDTSTSYRTVSQEIASQSGERGLDVLTQRERDVLRLYIQGVFPAKIGRMLGISTNTVYQYAHRIAKKMSVDSIHDLVRLFDRREPR